MKTFFTKKIIILALRFVIKKIKTMKSWVTTLFGVLAAVGVLSGLVLACLNGADCDWSTMATQIMLIAGLLGVGWSARDNNKSSEEVGVK